MRQYIPIIGLFAVVYFLAQKKKKQLERENNISEDKNNFVEVDLPITLSREPSDRLNRAEIELFKTIPDTRELNENVKNKIQNLI